MSIDIKKLDEEQVKINGSNLREIVKEMRNQSFDLPLKVIANVAKTILNEIRIRAAQDYLSRNGGGRKNAIQVLRHEFKLDLKSTAAIVDRAMMS